MDREVPRALCALERAAALSPHRLPCTPRVALLKGRANYVCLHRLERATGEARLASREEAQQLRRIERFAAATTSGDRADLPDVPDDAPVWQHATSTRENCLGQECPRYKDCFVMKARRSALAADVVVINHHLFFADVVLRDEGVAELLPACNTLIFDEAHQLPDTARLFFGESVSTGRLIGCSTRMDLSFSEGTLSVVSSVPMKWMLVTPFSALSVPRRARARAIHCSTDWAWSARVEAETRAVRTSRKRAFIQG